MYLWQWQKIQALLYGGCLSLRCGEDYLDAQSWLVVAQCEGGVMQAACGIDQAQTQSIAWGAAVFIQPHEALQDVLMF